MVDKTPLPAPAVPPKAPAPKGPPEGFRPLTAEEALELERATHDLTHVVMRLGQLKEGERAALAELSSIQHERETLDRRLKFVKQHNTIIEKRLGIEKADDRILQDGQVFVRERKQDVMKPGGEPPEKKQE